MTDVTEQHSETTNGAVPHPTAPPAGDAAGEAGARST